jgi:hypothetical protein
MGNSAPARVMKTMSQVGSGSGGIRSWTRLSRGWYSSSTLLTVSTVFSRPTARSCSASSAGGISSAARAAAMHSAREIRVMVLPACSSLV